MGEMLRNCWGEGIVDFLSIEQPAADLLAGPDHSSRCTDRRLLRSYLHPSCPSQVHSGSDRAVLINPLLAHLECKPLSVLLGGKLAHMTRYVQGQLG